MKRPTMTSCAECSRTFRSPIPRRLCGVCYAKRLNDDGLLLAEEAWERGYNLGLKRGGAEKVETMNIEPNMLRHMITLCHPDRHPQIRFHVANEVTAYLNAMRDNQ